jgi:tRNA 5-methylaminomethyl-2-thiouridine biosynthesis bifunctional protein
MKTAPITPGRLDFTADGVPHSPDFDDIFHPAVGALPQARHVFLAGNGLPTRWAGRERFVVLETGFGLGHNFLATWDAWRKDPQCCDRLLFVSIEKHPLQQVDLRRAHAAAADRSLADLASQLVQAWPPLTPNLHPLDFEAGRVQLLLGLGGVALLLRQLLASVDAFFLDGFAPARNPAMWDAGVFQRLHRLAAPGATAATWSAARVVHDGLVAAGFEVSSAPGIGGKRDITVARFAPRHVAAPPAGGWHAHTGPREALVIGAGLAGCGAAWALARQGWRCTVIDGESRPAQATSGNPAGLFHGSVHADDGPHARAHRAAALLTSRIAKPWIDAGTLPGTTGGCLRLDGRLSDARAAEALSAQRLPSDYVDWLDHEAATAATGLALPSGGWWFGSGGWLAPATYASALLAASGAFFLGGRHVAAISNDGGAWQALDAHGRVIAEAPVLVLANALDAQRLLPAAAAGWSMRAVRGQISMVGAIGLPTPVVPVAGAGYLLPLTNGMLLFGAASQKDDPDPSLRLADHRHNLQQLASLAGGDARSWMQLPWTGRVGWRAVTPDRLPLIGAVVDATAQAAASRADQPRFVPRMRDASSGLYVFTGLGSRGIGWAALGGQALASWITGAPCPLETDLRDALDPARFALRRRASPESSD